MTARIVAERLTDRRCEKHPDTEIVEVLFRSDQLKNDWVLGICPLCNETATKGGNMPEDTTTGDLGGLTGQPNVDVNVDVNEPEAEEPEAEDEAGAEDEAEEEDDGA